MIRSTPRPAVLFVLFVLFATSSPACVADPLHDHRGRWLGDMTLPNGQVMKIGADLYARADGSAWASIASPDQDMLDVPVKAIRTGPGDALLLDADTAQLALTWHGDGVDGEWRQGDKPLPFTLHRVAAFPMRARPQAPQPPFPYRDRELAIRVKPGVTLGATLSVPTAPARPDLVVLVSGSGPGTRHADLAGHRLFDVLADYLARRGIAVLRYDKRGVGFSTGDFYGHTLAGLEDDALAVLRQARRMGGGKRFGRIGIVGHSEGAAVAANAAARHPDVVDFVVSMGGVGLNGVDLELLQDRQQAIDNGAGPADVDRLMAYVRRYYETVLATPDGAPRLAALNALFDGLPADDRARVVTYRMNEGTLMPAYAANPALRVGLSTNPADDWRRVRCPVLVLGGGLDHQVPAAENVAGIVGALRAGGNRRVESAILPSLNHPFQTARTGAPDEYGRIDETMAPAAMDAVARFVRTQER